MSRICAAAGSRDVPNLCRCLAFADRMNSLPKYVVSTTLQAADWNNSGLITENIVEQVSAFRRQSGQDILVAGSADLVHTLTQHDLVDEYRLMVFSVILGTGKRLFQGGRQKSLPLVKTETFNSGVIVLTYRPDGKAG